MDAIELLTQQHREVEELFGRYEQLPEGDADEREAITRDVIRKLVVHAQLEEQAFYPMVREAIPELDDEIAHDLDEHQEAEQLLARLEDLEPADDEEEEDGYDATFGGLIAAIRHHVAEEEKDLFPRVRTAIDAETLLELGSAMETLAAQVPTRPHPHAPNEPPANVLTGPLAAALDRLRDAVRPDPSRP